MEIIYKMMILVVLVIFLVSGGFAVSNACIDIVSANNYLEEVSRVIFESNYSEKVIKACCETVNDPVMLYVFIKNKRAVCLYART